MTDQPTPRQEANEENEKAEGTKFIFSLVVLGLAAALIAKTDHGKLRNAAIGNLVVAIHCITVHSGGRFHFAKPLNFSSFYGPTHRDLDIHMRYIGRVILAGLLVPELGKGETRVLRGIAKRSAPLALERKAQQSVWGFHAGSGLCLRPILLWTNGLVVVGLAFVPIWLRAIDDLDLQKAFTPVTFLMTLMTICLATAALSNMI
ncbi:hypothetical protein CEP54_008132 [Fusarium duplospermum]|uniref:Uncharacterized protein n=1 Tax=Fusarium duplospermum TaxID=1325734 RepID=A0A428PXH6_9HYPO|nr:hypothetical protein CEP54_008132 [Fusarium duplospermum]